MVATPQKRIRQNVKNLDSLIESSLAEKTSIKTFGRIQDSPLQAGRTLIPDLGFYPEHPGHPCQFAFLVFQALQAKPFV
jgi:hypothetical protein